MEDLALLEMEYQGHKILLTKGHRFSVEDDQSDFATYEEAERRIDRIVAAESKQKKEKLSIPVLRSDGQEFVITGIHASNYSPLGIKFDAAQHRGMMYPASDKVRDLLSRRRALMDQINDIDASLRKYQIHYDYGWTRRNSTYDEMLTQLKNAVATALKALKEDAA